MAGLQIQGNDIDGQAVWSGRIPITLVTQSTQYEVRSTCTGNLNCMSMVFELIHMNAIKKIKPGQKSPLLMPLVPYVQVAAVISSQERAK